MKHQKFTSILANSQFADYLLLEQSINADGGAVKMQRWSDGVREFQRWPKGSKRPDVLVLTDSDFKAELLKGGGVSLHGKVESAVDLKTMGATLAPEWIEAVAKRLKISPRAIFGKRPSLPLCRAYMDTIGGLQAGPPLKFMAYAGPDIVAGLGELYFSGRDVADAQNDENPYVGFDSAGGIFSIGVSYEPIHFPFKSRFTKTRFRKEAGWFLSPQGGPFAGLTIPISQKEHQSLLDRFKRDGTTLFHLILP